MIRYLLSAILLFCMQHTICAQTAHWITADHADRDVPNTWIEFHKDITLTGKPKDVYAQIAADTKYWLWINESLVVFEGGLKRCPTPHDTYYDVVNVDGTRMMLRIPRALLGVDDASLDFEFKWSDNMQDEGNLMDFYVNGDVAPGGRFNYVYAE